VVWVQFESRSVGPCETLLHRSPDQCTYILGRLIEEPSWPAVEATKLVYQDLLVRRDAHLLTDEQRRHQLLESVRGVLGYKETKAV